jgi:hypothetical protein
MYGRLEIFQIKEFIGNMLGNKKRTARSQKIPVRGFSEDGYAASGSVKITKWSRETLHC